MTYIITKKAKKDLDDIWFNIAKDKVSAANKFEDQLLESFDLIVDNPKIGKRRDDLIDLPNIYFWVVHNYYVIYNPNTDPLQILRIMSSYRDIKNNY